jgi:hypothetical protein
MCFDVLLMCSGLSLLCIPHKTQASSAAWVQEYVVVREGLTRKSITGASYCSLTIYLRCANGCDCAAHPPGTPLFACAFSFFAATVTWGGRAQHHPELPWPASQKGETKMRRQKVTLDGHLLGGSLLRRMLKGRKIGQNVG